MQSEEEIEKAFQIGFQVTGPRATLAAIVAVLAESQADPQAFRLAILAKVTDHLPEGLDRMPPDAAEGLREGARTCAAEILGLDFEVLERPVSAH